MVVCGNHHRIRAQPGASHDLSGSAWHGRIVRLAVRSAGHRGSSAPFRSKPGERNLQLGRSHRSRAHAVDRHATGGADGMALPVRDPGIRRFGLGCVVYRARPAAPARISQQQSVSRSQATLGFTAVCHRIARCRGWFLLPDVLRLRPFGVACHDRPLPSLSRCSPERLGHSLARSSACVDSGCAALDHHQLPGTSW